MKAIMLMFDSLRKDMLSAYGNDETITPNFKRLEEKSVKFDNCFVGSMPCMPARRDLQTGRYNFMHRSWGPMEPYDNSAPELLKKNGIHSHLVTDHKHYWREGGATYHPRYSTYEFIRGQEGDAWKGHVKKPDIKNCLNEPDGVLEYKNRSRQQDSINRRYMESENQHPLCKTVSAGLDFIETNKEEDQWFVQIECFDPHEPFFVPQKYLDMYGVKEEFNGWPPYYYDNLEGNLSETIKNYYKALLTMCDEYVGKLLDKMDALNLWEDTMLIVTTDHGFLLGEHQWWGKNIMPLYNEIANIPFFVYDPKNKKGNIVKEQLVQNIDVAPTLLQHFNIDIPKEMCGKPIQNIIEADINNHENILFGYHGSNINICDKDYIYMRAPKGKTNTELYEYTLMPTHMSSMFSIKELKNISLSDPFDFTKGIQLLKIPVQSAMASNYNRFSNRLYSLKKDRKQLEIIEDIDKEYEMVTKMIALMKENDAPEELYSFYGLENITKEKLRLEKKQYRDFNQELISGITFKDEETIEGYLTFVKLNNNSKDLKKLFLKETLVDKEVLSKIILSTVPKERQNEIFYQVNLNMRIN